MILLSRRFKSCLPLIVVTSVFSLVLLYMSHGIQPLNPASSQDQLDHLSGNIRIHKRVILDEVSHFVPHQGRNEEIDLTGKGKKENSFISNNPLEKDIIPRRGEVLHNMTKDPNNKLSIDKTETKADVICDDECVRFRQLLSNWPQNKPVAAFYYLTQSSRMDFFLESLASVDEHFNLEFNYPIIVFHEDEFSHKIPDVRRSTKSNIFFQKIMFTIPEFLEEPVPENVPCVSRISYRHMCRFHAKGIYEEPIMQDLEYYWRLDDDSLLLSKINYDVFEYMEKNAFQYGYHWRHLDAMSCTEGLWEATDRYIEVNNITTQFYKYWKRPYLYYNNFEISKMSMWISQEYQKYIDYIDHLGGMYYHRWGDAPIKGIAIAMFIPRNDLHLFDDIGYQHRSYVHIPKLNGL